MSFPPWHHHIDCHVCKARVFYGKGRRVCRRCRVWFHAECGIDTKDYPYDAYCLPCTKVDPVPWRRLAKFVGEVKERWPALEVVLWSTYHGTDLAEMDACLAIGQGKLASFDSALREAGIWTPDGRIAVDEDVDMDKMEELSVFLILCAMVADGMVERKRVDPAAPPVQDGGGNENAEPQQVQEAVEE